MNISVGGKKTLPSLEVFAINSPKCISWSTTVLVCGPCTLAAFWLKLQLEVVVQRSQSTVSAPVPAPLDPLVETGRDEFSAGVWWLQPWKCLQLMVLGQAAESLPCLLEMLRSLWESHSQE